MIDLTEKSAIYAAGKTNEVIDKAIAQAYADGYRDGYKDREEEIPVDLRENQTEYVDLGLPSGTLWAKDFEKTEGGSVLSLTYGEACHLSIPTTEQWTELKKNCIWQKVTRLKNGSNRDLYECIGPNGKTIEFTETGYYSAEQVLYSTNVYFWTKGEINDNRRTAARMRFFIDSNVVDCDWENLFTGFRLPVRLVKIK